MAHRFLTRILVGILLLSATLCSGITEVWACRGRVCSSASGQCCCSVPSAGVTPHAAPGGPAPAASRTYHCSGACGCVLLITDCAGHSASAIAGDALAPFAFPPSLPVSLPHGVYVAPALADVIAHSLVPRGPPPVRAARLAAVGLRAPPAA